MASALMHMAVAKKVNEKLNMDYNYLILGSIAPDLGKELNIPRAITHFQNETENVPIVDKFINKYKNYENNPYEMGYLIHLITDVLWFKEFIKNFNYENIITLKNGTKIEMTDTEFGKLIYNDYTNIGSQLLDYYDMDLSVFYNEYPLPDTNITEVPISSLRLLIDKMSLICTNLGTEKEYIITIDKIVHFIDYAAIYVLDELDRYRNKGE
ncbi:MAG TPA: zinc dependent phospholipase C family protein [Bacilli bacterium]|nr:zinc dependent phospholipase C family protein [Bacilli bacterium]